MSSLSLALSLALSLCRYTYQRPRDVAFSKVYRSPPPPSVEGCGRRKRAGGLVRAVEVLACGNVSAAGSGGATADSCRVVVTTPVADTAPAAAGVRAAAVRTAAAAPAKATAAVVGAAAARTAAAAPAAPAADDDAAVGVSCCID